MIYSFGDLNIDIIVDLPGKLPGPSADLSGQINTRIRPGGVAFNFFSKAVENGHSVRIIGSLGDDAFGSYFLDHLEIETRRHILINGEAPTGLNITLQLISGNSLSKRIFLSNNDSANYFKTRSDQTSVLPDFNKNDILFFTGYNLFRPSSRDLCFELVRHAVDSNARIVFDLLPHDLSKVGNNVFIKETLKEIAKARFDLCIAEYQTWSYLFGEHDPDPYPDDRRLIDIGQKTGEITKYASIRYGKEHCSNESLFFDGARLWDKRTGYEDVAAEDRIGYGDLLTIELIEQLFIGQHVWRYEIDAKFTIPLSVLDYLPENIDRKSKVLDIGAGYGRTYDKLNELGFTDITGIEHSPSMVAEARKSFPHISTLHGNILNCELPDRKYQIALLIGILTTFQQNSDVALILEKVYNILDQDGVLLITEFAINDSGIYQQRYQNYRNLFPESFYGTFITNDGAIHRHYDIDDVKKMAEVFFEVCIDREINLESMSGNQSKGFVLLLKRRFHND